MNKWEGEYVSQNFAYLEQRPSEDISAVDWVWAAAWLTRFDTSWVLGSRGKQFL